MPVSSTSMRSVASEGVLWGQSTRTVTPPLWVNFTALPTRLNRICRSRPPSPTMRPGTLGPISTSSRSPFSRARSCTIDRVMESIDSTFTGT